MRTLIIAIALLAAAPAFASQNGTLYGSCGNPGANCGPHVADSTAGRETCAGGNGRCQKYASQSGTAYADWYMRKYCAEHPGDTYKCKAVPAPVYTGPVIWVPR